MQLEVIDDQNLTEILEQQKEEANIQFGKLVEKNYEDWINNDEEAPLFSHKLFVRKVVPELRNEENVLFIVIDNLRYDQWKSFESIVNQYYKVDKEDYYYSILRSEERRVGKECRSRWSPYDEKKKKERRRYGEV